MQTTIFKGEQFALDRGEQLKKRVRNLGFKPKLVSIFFKEDKMGILYTRLKQEMADRLGVHFHPEEISYEVPVSSVCKIIAHYSEEPAVQALMIQKPVLKYVAEAPDVGHLGYASWWKTLTEEINPAKDVDCLTDANLQRVFRESYSLLPATVRAVLTILETAKVQLAGKTAAIVGRSDLVGRPLAHVLAQKGAKVMMCGSNGLAEVSVGAQLSDKIKPMTIAEVCLQSELVVSAAGNPGLIKAEMIRGGAVVIDVGEPVGDVDFDKVVKKAGFITPVPGGVGPVTVVSLYENLMDLVS